jgi:hypothetical protein
MLIYMQIGYGYGLSRAVKDRGDVTVLYEMDVVVLKLHTGEGGGSGSGVCMFLAKR